MKNSAKKTLFAIIVLFVLSVALILFSFDPLQKKSVEKPHIIYIYKTTLRDITFWDTLTQGIAAGAAEYGYTYSIIGAVEETDIEGNIEALEKAATMHPAAIVLAASDYNLLEPYAKAAADSGILLLTIDSDVAGGVSRCYIGTDNYLAGSQMASEMKRITPQKRKIAIVSNVKESHSSFERIRGIMDEFKNDDESTIIEPVFCENKVALSQDLTRELLEKNSGINGIIATNEISALGVARTIDNLGLKDKISVITCDNSKNQISYLEQGVIDATIVQKPFNMGYFSMNIADALLKNRDDMSIPTFYDTGSEVITIENYYTPENQKLLFPFEE